MVPSDPADRQGRFASIFSDLVRGTRDWEAWTPVLGWLPRDGRPTWELARADWQP